MGTYESISNRPSVFSSSYMKIRSESKEKLLPKQKILLSYQKKNFCQENISPNLQKSSKSPLQRIRDKRSTWLVSKPSSQHRLRKSLSDLIKGMTKHSGNSIDDDNYLYTETNLGSEYFHGPEGSLGTPLFLNDESELSLQLLLQNCTQTLSRTDNKFSGFFSDIQYNSKGQKLTEAIDRITPGTAHFKMEAHSFRQNLLDLTTSNIESDGVTRKISFDYEQSTRNFQPPQNNISNDSNLSYLMDSIDEFYKNIQSSLPMNEMPKDSVSTRYQPTENSLQASRCTNFHHDDSLNNQFFPEEDWIRKSQQRRSIEVIKKSIELRKIEAMLDQPVKAVLILPPDFSVNNSQEIISNSSILSSRQSLELEVLKKEFKQQFEKLFVKAADKAEKPLQQQYWKLRENEKQRKGKFLKK